MDTKSIKAYAPQARRDFIAAVTNEAAVYGLTAEGISPVTQQGDVAIIGGQAYPKTVAAKRTRLEERIQRDGFDQVMEAVAYTWFNRFVAIRYMELHGYLEHGYRVLSHPEGKSIPEILEHATEVDLPGLDQAKVIELKLDGTRDEELYRLLLTAQCHALHQAMPFLFESLDDETELLLPDRLLHTDSLVRCLVESIEESAWESIEIVGWLYQFYISEKKDQVIGKVVKSEDIPAATQLFTPNWIVKYMVQNSLGAQWLATYPDSALKARMEFYIEPAEQTEEVKEQLAAITPTSLNPEEITCIDPACGSGHILVEAYDLFKAIYLERGYRPRDVPRLILEKNLFGLDIDERAAQLTGFALTMKGRADDRRLFTRGVQLNVQALRDSSDFDPEVIDEELQLADYGLGRFDLVAIKSLFEHAKTFGALIEVSASLAEKLPALQRLSEATSQNLYVVDALKHLQPLVQQAEMLATQYDAVVANPPYMGSKGMNTLVKKFAKEHFPDSKSDLFAVSTERFLLLAQPAGFVSLMTPFTWMFLKSYESLRTLVLEAKTLQSLIQPEYHAFFDSAYVPVCTFTIQNLHTSNYSASFINLSDFYGADLQPTKTLEAINNPECSWLYKAKPDEFKKIPGSPVAYCLSAKTIHIFETESLLGTLLPIRGGMTTADNEKFVRLWFEIDELKFARPPGREGAKWFPYNKGGEYRKWFGNRIWVVNWEDGGRDIKATGRASVRSEELYLEEMIGWTDVTSFSQLGVRYYGAGFLFDASGPALFPNATIKGAHVLGFLASRLASIILQALNPTLHIQAGNVSTLPWLDLKGDLSTALTQAVHGLLAGSQADWNSYERSWDFQSLPIVTASSEVSPTIKSSYAAWITQNHETIAEMKCLEEKNNLLFNEAYDLQDELTAELPIEQVTLTVNPTYRYGGNLTEEDGWIRFRQDTMKELASYAIGCMMGRYSLDEPGLIYAHSGNEDFDPSRYTTFPADDDGIIPLTDLTWFDDDATHRLEEFLSVAWDKAHLEENLAFLSENLSPKRSESSLDTLRRYLATKFFKDHLQTYKKRPIYWLFSSGKRRAFQCLVYLHRYHEGTLGRMRTEYVIPLQGRMASRIQQLEGDITGATSTSHRKKLEKERDTLLKQRIELQEYDEKLRHYADQRIHLDLDDGVKVNYGKFGDLLAEVKAVTGKKPA